MANPPANDASRDEGCLMAASFSGEIPERLVLVVPVPQRLSEKNIQETAALFESHLRYLLGQRYKRQSRERTVARIAAQDARKAARAAALRAAESACVTT
jgi:hypothetical protein